jgi:hypothetical protein
VKIDLMSRPVGLLSFELRSALGNRSAPEVAGAMMLLTADERARLRAGLDAADQQGMLQNLIALLKSRAAALEAHAAKDLTALEGEIEAAKNTVEGELESLLAKLQNI